jgi:hypothetical protein
MKPGKKLTKSGKTSSGTRKTKEDFLRWLALKKRTAVPEVNPVSPPPTEALMVWADDGGPTT